MSRRWSHNAALVVLAVLLVMGAAPPAKRAAAQSPSPEPIYRLRITIVTSSSSQSLYLADPADIVTARVAAKRPANAGAAVGTFGAGPLSVTRPSSVDRAKARYVVAVTPGRTSNLILRSVKGRGGTSRIIIRNANGSAARRIASFRHKPGHGSQRLLRIRTAAVAAGGPVAGTSPLSPRVYSFYYPWYVERLWFTGAIARYNRNERPYDSGDPDAIQRHIGQARRAGIDGFISSWFGRGHKTDANLKILFDQLPTHGFKVGIYFETLSEAFTTKRTVVNAFRYVLDKYAVRPQYARYRGKPVIYIYQPQFILRPGGGAPNTRYATVWRSIFRTLRRDGYNFATIATSTNAQDLRLFNGLHLYGTRTTYTFNRQMGLIARAYAAVHGGGRRTWVVPVAPGYDDRHIKGRAGTYVPRNNGDHYRSQWWTAIQMHADAAVVLSFNEWYETTNIEPNRRWGDLYLDITARKAAAYK